jgi:hypothetical protein
VIFKQEFYLSPKELLIEKMISLNFGEIEVISYLNNLKFVIYVLTLRDEIKKVHFVEVVKKKSKIECQLTTVVVEKEK